jgi:hypothetical protein
MRSSKSLHSVAEEGSTEDLADFKQRTPKQRQNHLRTLTSLQQRTFASMISLKE